MTTQELEIQVERILEALHRDAGNDLEPGRVEAVGRAHFEALRRDATIYDFIPLLVYRYAREELIHIRREELHDAA